MIAERRDDWTDGWILVLERLGMGMIGCMGICVVDYLNWRNWFFVDDKYYKTNFFDVVVVFQLACSHFPLHFFNFLFSILSLSVENRLQTLNR